MEIFHKMISAALNLPEKQISNTLGLLAEGATIPFISRYRKEITGGLDEVQIESIKTQYDKLSELAKRKETILGTIGEQGKLTPELRQRIDATWDATALEDIYLPYKPKRKTRAEAARQKGLEPLALLLMMQRENNLGSRIPAFVKGDVKDAEDALKGARDIIAEQVSEDERARNAVRNLFARQAVISAKVVKGKDEEAAKYRDYFDFSSPLKRCTSHRLLAIRRAEAEGLLKVSITPDDDECLERLDRQFVRSNNECGRQVAEAVQDAYRRLLKPSIETEFASLSKEQADDEAIRVFAENLRQLLLAPPLGQKRVMGIDPGFRTGCKVVCLDAQGNLVHNENIYPHPPVDKKTEAASKLRKMIEAYKIEAIAIGNGTASRETENFVTHQQFDRPVQVFVVSEQGASIYSASKTARDEFPDYDVTVRGAVSIARRLMDPLAELVIVPEHGFPREEDHRLGEGFQAEFCFRFCKVAATDPACQLAAEAVAEQAHANAPGRCQHHQYRPDGWALHQQYQHQQDTQNRQTGGEHLQSPSWFLFHQIICLLAGPLLHSRARSIRPPSEWGGSWGCAWCADRYSCSVPRAHGS